MEVASQLAGLRKSAPALIVAPPLYFLLLTRLPPNVTVFARIVPDAPETVGRFLEAVRVSAAAGSVQTEALKLECLLASGPGRSGRAVFVVASGAARFWASCIAEQEEDRGFGTEDISQTISSRGQCLARSKKIRSLLARLVRKSQ